MILEDMPPMPEYETVTTTMPADFSVAQELLRPSDLVRHAVTKAWAPPGNRRYLFYLLPDGGLECNVIDVRGSVGEAQVKGIREGLLRAGIKLLTPMEYFQRSEEYRKQTERSRRIAEAESYAT